MMLPNVIDAVVAEDKIVRYLLNTTHPDGAGKAKFFLGLGYSTSNWQELAAALRSLAVNSSVTTRVETKHGTKYIVDGTLIAPGSQSVFVRTVWIVDAGQTTPRLVSAYPADPGDQP